MSTLRFELLREALGRKAVPVSSENRPADDFAKYVFNREKMQKYLSKHT
jgi:glutamine synthetase